MNQDRFDIRTMGASKSEAEAKSTDDTRQDLWLITLHLARCQACPEGSARHGYQFLAPLDRSGYLDASVWRKLREHCLVRRFWEGETDRRGHLVHRRGGAGGATWCFAQGDFEEQEQNAGYRLRDHRFVAGDYVSFGEEDGDNAVTFRVAEVKKAAHG